MGLMLLTCALPYILILMLSLLIQPSSCESCLSKSLCGSLIGKKALASIKQDECLDYRNMMGIER